MSAGRPPAALMLSLALAAAPAAPSAVFRIRADRTWSPDSSGPFPADPGIIRPVWCRQNIWKPWRQWAVSPPKAFAPYLREAALVMPLGGRPSPDPADDVPSLYRTDASGKPLAFDPGHPFFRMLLRLRQAGIKPVIDIGAVPKELCARVPGAHPGFDFGIGAPADSARYGRYYAYIRDLFLFLQSPGFFTREELEGWDYQLGREPDNPEAWDPAGAKAPNDARNLAAYQRLYDWTLAGMRAAGLRKHLDPGNLSIPFPGCMGYPDSWMGPLAEWLASGAPAQCPFLTGPRLRPGDTVTFSFTAYAGGQIGLDPDDLAQATAKARAAIVPAFPQGGFRISVAEGNLTRGMPSNRGEATERGGAWTAGICKAALDAGLHRYQQWGFGAASHISEFDDGGGVMPAAYNVILLMRRMEGGTRLPLAAALPDAPKGSRLDGLAARDGTGALRILAYHFRPERGSLRVETVSLRVTGLPANRRYRLARYRVDRTRGNYFAAWEAARGKDTAAGDDLDALVLHRLSARQRAAWESHREDYRRLSAAGAEPEGPGEWIRTGPAGDWTRSLTLPANAVVLLELVPADTARPVPSGTTR